MGQPDVRIRMYRGILGDSFLLRTGTGDGARHILIDCGVLQKSGPKTDPDTGMEYRGGNEQIRRVAEDIMQTLDGKPLDVLVVTHEHYDHLSGFILAHETFKSLQFNELWMAWTENSADSQAQALGQARSAARLALSAFAARISDSDGAQEAEGKNAFGPGLKSSEPHFAGTLEKLMGFSGDVELPATAKTPGKKRRAGATATQTKPYDPNTPPTRIDHVIPWLKSRCKSGGIRYLEPGQMLKDVLPGFKVHVLGPPRENDYLAQTDPSGGVAREVYFAPTSDANMWLGAVENQARTSSEDLYDMPFSDRFVRPIAEVEASVKAARAGTDSLRSHDSSPETLYFSPDQDATNRQITYDWCRSAGEFALRLDTGLNNTSLVLAFERTVPGAIGDMLLFPGDAQVGNWLSWKLRTYPKDGPNPIRIEELLAKVVFYKVGHHGSENATLKSLGLELMTDPRLAAGIPVVRKVAETKKGWDMPYPKLEADILARTFGRVLRGDSNAVVETSKFPVDAVSYADKTINPLWVEYHISGDTLREPPGVRAG